MKKELELRMYGFVPYNISEIQKGIQFGHGVVEYSLNYNDSLYQSWAKNWKTFIILNGGTSNHSVNRYMNEYNSDSTTSDFIGSMEKTLSLLNGVDIKLATFNEPDMNDMLSAIVFIVDERVFNFEKYPGFLKFLQETPPYPGFIHNNDVESMIIAYPSHYKKWKEIIGGEKNVFLKSFLYTQDGRSIFKFA